MKKLVYLAIATLVALLILMPTAVAQQKTKEGTTTKTETTQPLPSSGGLTVGSSSVLLPAAALLVGPGVLAYAVLRRRG